MAGDFHKSEDPNRFYREGEILIGTFRGDRLLGISGLNRDPYVDDRRVGRLRHLYVAKNERCAGSGRVLVGLLPGRPQATLTRSGCGRITPGHSITASVLTV